ncbi:MAG: IS110 family transposase, partial [Gammaproteobacteria bacterium]|nr:IS110 family transposase [Gammaproteobacteria bacterium]
MGYYVGIDLHSNNNYIGIIDQENRRVLKKKSINDLSEITKTLYPYKREIQGIVVESTFNWYWIVDGLMEAGYRVHLANPSAIKQYEGLKYTDDTW